MKLYCVEVKVPKQCPTCLCSNAHEWVKIRPTNGIPYLFTLKDAQDYIDTYSNFTSRSDVFRIVPSP